MNRRVALLVATILAVALGIMALQTRAEKNELTALFPRTTSLYKGAKVKVLGVDVGSVTSIAVKGTAVEVRISYDNSVRLPRDVHALIVPPSIVGDRFVQLAPPYESGPTLPDNARLDLDHTGVPLELDQTYRSLDQFAAGLGPEGANKHGALSRLISATARNLDGHGRQFNRTVRDLAGAVSTLASSSDDIAGTVSNLRTVADTLADEDPQMRALVNNLAAVSKQLNRQRTDISDSVTSLREALDLVATFTKSNRSEARTTIAGIAEVSGVLDRRTDELSQLLDLSPVGLTSLTNIYVPTNWDPSKPWETPIEGRTGNGAFRGALFSDLDVQLGATLTTLCAELPTEQQQKLAGFCSALQSAGGSLGGILTDVLTSDVGSGGTPGARTLSELLRGVK